MSTPRTYRRRLEKLAAHIKSGKLGHKKFDFSQWNNADGPKCGTAGCAVGECPILFPRQWMWNLYGDPRLRVPPSAYAWVSAYGNSLVHAADFFGLDTDEVEHLFVPLRQKPERYGGSDLSDQATRRQVAKNIRAFLKIKKWS